MDMAGESTNVELQKGSENPVNHQAPHMSSDWQIHENNLTNTSIATIPTCNPTVENSFCPLIWDQPINCQSSAYCGVNVPNGTILKGNMFLPSVSGMGTQSLPHLLADSGFIERAARFSCFGGGNLVEMMNPFGVPNSMGLVQGENSLFLGTSEVARKEAFENEKKSENLHEESDKAEFSEEEGFGLKKRKRVTKGDEHDENNEAPHDFIDCAVEIKKNEDGKGTSASKNGAKSVKQGTQGTDQPKEEYIHVRARRGQATNSHSLAERVRREKISERMKLLQDLVPGCSKVTGKAVMLDEIINYVQSLQRQVEFLSMKLATVNPCMDFNIEALIAKDMLQNRAHILTSSLAFPPDTTMPFPPLHASRPGLIQPRLINNPCEIIQRPITLQSDAVSQVPGIWEDEFHNVHTGFNSGEPNNSQGLSDSLPPPHMKSEP